MGIDDWGIECSPRSPNRDDDACFAPPSADAATRTRALGVAKATSGDGWRRGSQHRHRRGRFGTLRNNVDRREAGRRPNAAHGGDGASRLVTSAAAKAADGRGQDAHFAPKYVYDFGSKYEQTEREGNRFLPPVQENNYGKLPLKASESQGRAGKMKPISVDKMYSSQPSSTSLSAKRTQANQPFHKRRKGQLQNLSSNYSQKDLISPNPPSVSYNGWCPNPALGWNAPTLKKVIRRSANTNLDDQLIVKRKPKKPTAPYKPRKTRATSPQMSEGQLKALAHAAVDAAAQESDEEDEANPSNPTEDIPFIGEENLEINPENPQDMIDTSASPLTTDAGEEESISSPYLPFSLDDYIEEEVTSAAEGSSSTTIPDHIKAQLQKLVPCLELDITALVQDAGAVREIFNSIKNELPLHLKETLQPAAFIESNGPKFFSAQSRIAAREAQKDLSNRESQCIRGMLLVKQTIDHLKASPEKMNQELAALQEERFQLLSRLKIVDEAIKQKESALSKIPKSLAEQKKTMLTLNKDLQSIKNEKKANIPGTAEGDHQQIAEIDNIRLQALNSVKSLLNT